MSRIPENVYGVVLPASEPALLSEGGLAPVPEQTLSLPQRVACYVCLSTTRTYVLVSGTSYCLEHCPRPPAPAPTS